MHFKLLETMTINEDVLEKTVEEDFSNATELADYLVQKGIPFRNAHEVVGKVVLKCINEKKYLKDLSLEEFKFENEAIEADIYEVLSPKVVVDRRNSTGGTGTKAVKYQIEIAESSL